MPSRVRSLLKTFCACALVVLLAACARERPPTGTVRVETGDAVVNVAMLTHGYSWGGVANDPVAPSDLADDDVPDLDVARTLEARASFSQPAIEVEVTRCAEDGSLEDVACVPPGRQGMAHSDTRKGCHAPTLQIAMQAARPARETAGNNEQQAGHLNTS